MTEDRTREQAFKEPEPAPVPVGMDDPLPTINDPGGAHQKGFSADPRPEAPVAEEGPIPLAEAPKEDTSAVKVPERDNHVVPTGRNEPGDYKPNDRLMGSDR